MRPRRWSTAFAPCSYGPLAADDEYPSTATGGRLGEEGHLGGGGDPVQRGEGMVSFLRDSEAQDLGSVREL